MSVIVQKASKADLDNLHMIEQKSFTAEAWSKKQIAMFLGSTGSVSLIAKVGGRIVGFVIGLIERYDGFKLGHIITIDVLPDYRRKGIGMALLKSVEQEFKKADLKICYLEVREDNRDARRLYHKAGYVEIERLQNYYPRGGHGVRLEKTLLL